MLKSLKSRIILSTFLLVGMSLTVTTLFVTDKTRKHMSDTIEQKALNLLAATKNHIESQHRSILFHEASALNRRKEELKNMMSVAISVAETVHTRYTKGTVSRGEAGRMIKDYLRNMRYADKTGYFWINDTTSPLPRMVMHPTMPELDGQVLDNPDFNQADGGKANLFRSFVEICKSRGEGYVEYKWSKPLKEGLTVWQPKISFVKLFNPFNWIIGTGLYIDDINKDVQKRIDTVIRDLNRIIAKQRIGETGYFFIMNEENKIIVHPYLAGRTSDSLKKESNGVVVVEQFKTASRLPHKSIEYLWTRNNDKRYIHTKKAFVSHYEPLGWYICCTIYKEELEDDISEIEDIIIVFTSSFLILALILSFFVARSITTPLNKLTDALNNTSSDGIPLEPAPAEGSSETMLLGSTINNLLASIDSSGRELKLERDFSLNIIEASPLIICSTDTDGQALSINSAGEEITGFSKEEIIGTTLWNTLLPEDIYRELYPVISEISAIPLTEKEITITRKDNKLRSIIWTTLSNISSSTTGKKITIWFGHDITSRKEAIKALEYSENRYRTLFEQSADATLIIQANKFINCNLAALKMLGADSKNRVIKTHPSVLSPPKQPDGRFSFEKAEDMIRTAFVKGNHRFEWIHKRFNGEEFPVEILLTAIPEHEETLLHVVWRDITKRKEAERAIVESEKRYRTLVEHATEALVVYDMNNRHFVDVNENACKLFGLSKEELLKLSPSDVSPYTQPGRINSKELSEKYLEAAMEGETPVFEWLCLNLKNGRTIPCEVRFVRLPSSGKVLIRGSLIDITDRKKAEDDLKTAHRQLQNVLDSATQISIISTTPEGIIEIFNKGAENMLGYSADELTGKHTPAKFHRQSEIQEYSRQLSEEYGEKVEGFDIFTRKAREIGYEEKEWTYVKKDGTHIRVNMGVTAVLNNEQHITGYLGVCMNITERKEAEEQLRQYKEQLEDIIRERTEALKTAQRSALSNAHKAGMSEIASGVLHHVGNILTSAITSSRVIDRKIKNSNLKNIKKCSNILEENINSPGEFFETEQGQKLIKYLILSAGELEQEFRDIIENRNRLEEKIYAISQVVAMQKSYAESHAGAAEPLNPVKIINNIINMQITPEELRQCTLKRHFKTVPSITGHKTKLIHILLTLIRNGFENLKHLPVKKRVMHIETESDDSSVYIRFRYSGIEFSNETLQEIFSFDYTTDNDYYGLKLHICANFMTEMGGEIIAGNSDEGTTFTLRFSRSEEDQLS